MAVTSIGWTDFSFNPWWGCERVSPACQHCYAETFAKRTGHQVWGRNSERRFFGDKHWAEPVRWATAAIGASRRPRVFCASMADVFEDRPDLGAARQRLFDLIEATPQLDWQLLTKRPENVARMAQGWESDGWPAHVWLGATVEDGQRAAERIPPLLDTGAQLHFLSCEPLLGDLDLTPWLHDSDCHIIDESVCTCTEPREARVDWVIVGGESGAGARRMDPIAAREIVGDCAVADVPVFVKQAGKVLGKEWGCSDSAGSDWSAWPEWARRRAFPA